MTISFGDEDHQGMDSVHFTRLHKGRFVPLEDWSVLGGYNGTEGSS